MLQLPSIASCPIIFTPKKHLSPFFLNLPFKQLKKATKSFSYPSLLKTAQIVCSAVPCRCYAQLPNCLGDPLLELLQYASVFLVVESENWTQYS